MSAAVRHLSVAQIEADAELTATFFRQLVEKGVPLQAAVTLTSSYVSSFMISRGEKPRDPWEESDDPPRA